MITHWIEAGHEAGSEGRETPGPRRAGWGAELRRLDVLTNLAVATETSGRAASRSSVRSTTDAQLQPLLAPPAIVGDERRAHLVTTLIDVGRDIRFDQRHMALVFGIDFIVERRGVVEPEAKAVLRLGVLAAAVRRSNARIDNGF